MSQQKYVSLEEAALYARKQKLSSIKEWLEASENAEFPDSMPKRPPNVYGCKWSEVLAPKTAPGCGRFVEFKKACEIARTLGVQTMSQYRELSKEGGRPSNLPSNPNLHYKDEWQGWAHFLTGREDTIK
ncbi:hypothetical protein J8L73_18730 [Pseudoalteromonas sp. MMG006]|uniref:hypothetical protein n=1 Tax=Pseudoalteromonas sp. MMG006 TaxID=2822683 RepID=UPI001B388BA2|nr:hypothetical protein [Pseudoalteromonas sp. MMG006]MBQ4801129.1 hypothetical protein [Pseudoalteromonas sp. MMG006]